MEGLWVEGRRSRVVGREVEEVMKVTLFNDCAGCGLSMRACRPNSNVTDSE